MICWTSPHLELVLGNTAALLTLIIVMLWMLPQAVYGSFDWPKRVRRALRLQSRITESNNKLLSHPRTYVIGHAITASIIAGLIALSTVGIAQTRCISEHRVMWHLATAVLPILLAADAAFIWHKYLARQLEEAIRTAWILLVFWNPGRVPLNLPTPETYLVIAATAGAAAATALRAEPFTTKMIIAAISASLTAGGIAFAGPRVGTIASRGLLWWQTEILYKNMINRKADTQRRIMGKQHHQCAKCNQAITPQAVAFAISDYATLQYGRVPTQRIQALCLDFANDRPTTRWVET